MAASPHIPVIGSGSIGTRHYNNLIELGISSELISYRSGGVEAVESLLQRGAAHGVVIATATHIRQTLISLCAQFNVPMYIEKPLAYTAAQVNAIYACCSAELQSRTMAGYMMRYHPLLQTLRSQNLSSVYRFDLTIGHDVTQWRKDWQFQQSYASRAQGGGVLLDLCHELDIARSLFPHLKVSHVSCLGHAEYPGVDFSTRVEMDLNTAGTGTALHGCVTMDYLSPVSTRVSTFYALDHVTQIDFNALSYERRDNTQVHRECIEFERNELFTGAMQDFIRLVKGEPVSEYCPTLDKTRHSIELVASAWEQRQFTSLLSQPIS